MRPDRWIPVSASTEFLPIPTVDVSRPRSATRVRRAAEMLGDLGLAVVFVLVLPLVVVVGAPIAIVAWAVLAIRRR